MSNKVDSSQLCEIIEDAIKTSSNKSQLSENVTMDSKLGKPVEWDSMSFVVVFTAVSDSYDIEVEDDDAIMFTSVGGIIEFLEEVL